MIPASIKGGKELGFVLDTGTAAYTLLESQKTACFDIASQGQLIINGAGEGEGSQASFTHNVDIGFRNVLQKKIFDEKPASIPFSKAYMSSFLRGL